MLISFAKADIKDADEAFLYSRVRFIYRSIAGQGVAAVWEENLDDNSATRLARVEGVRLDRRRTARRPHVLTLSDGTEWHIWPRHGGSCCGARVTNFSYDDLLSPELETL